MGCLIHRRAGGLNQGAGLLSIKVETRAQLLGDGVTFGVIDLAIHSRRFDQKGCCGQSQLTIFIAVHRRRAAVPQNIHEPLEHSSAYHKVAPRGKHWSYMGEHVNFPLVPADPGLYLSAAMIRAYGDLPHAPATARNRDAIFAVLGRVLPSSGTILEVASGTGEHAAYLALRLAGLTWQPSDADAGAVEMIGRRVAAVGAANLLAPLRLDVCTEIWPIRQADAVVCVNMIHISSWAAVAGLMQGAGRLLTEGSVLYFYGPYKIGGHHTTPSNAAFDDSLRRRNADWGVRDLEAVTDEAQSNGFAFIETVDMPANNLSVIFKKTV